MLNLEAIYKNESIEDVLLYFAPRTPYPSIDRMYVRYRFEAVASGELLRTHQRLFQEGKLKKTGRPLPEKGPSWKEPKFVTEKKYGIV
ncbi:MULTISPECIES: immunity protein [Pseudomonas aeruginosa group]|uniref:Immunity protein n=1 Tax=Pseudomonas aeruginosa TaxID=287 RepID=A0A6A9KBT5_PSEAI|nr:MULTISPECIES: immunity protein [Pseudomonas aeruginosa group]EJB8386660.1 immunity protein [Pseudomonas aeruginosa]EKX2036213.1 immunity protein [Pseudomonas aeruginosa]MBG7008460.1 immunity protein [Pseudomonas aeruginosa]MBG7025771.1 immunity protein [Pseudomonas aeruginosa]MBG7373008.1 immunity protein [Pseudomonas aeruginosa]